MTMIWIPISGLLGFSVAAFFAGYLKLPRNIYLLAYIPLVAAYVTWFILGNDISFKDIITRNWYWGLLGATVAGIFVIKNVVSQPSSEKNKGVDLLTDIIWAGLIYGLADALLLSIIPVLALNLAFSGSNFSELWYGKIGIGILALISSLFVTTLYHLGYPEFRGKQVLGPNVGNGVLSIAYIITLNPLAAILPHMAMHVAAIIHGRETTNQVPPHYK